MLMLNSKMLNKQQSVQTSLLFMIIITLNILFFVGNMISVQATTGTSSDTRSDGRSISNGTSNANYEEGRLINELVKTGKFTKDEAREFVSKVMLINELVKTGKFTKDEAREFVSKVMKNGTDGSTGIARSNVPEANLTANVPVPEANLTANVSEANIPQNNNSGLVNLNISVKQNPISPGEEQTVTLTASDPITGEPLDRIFVHLTIKDPLGNVIKDYTDNDGKLSPTFVIGENNVGTFTILGTALQAGVESTKSLTFVVQ
jgi:polyhydroxyalkanoate synthesis regulator phasin